MNYFRCIGGAGIPAYNPVALYDVQSNLIPNVRITPSWQSGGSAGQEVSDNTYTATDYIPVTAGETIYWVKAWNGQDACGYDSNKNGIYDNNADPCIARHYRDRGMYSSFVVPAGMAYIRFSAPNAYMTDPMFNFYRFE